MIYNYYVYILSNTRNTVLYTGVTNNLSRRIQQHKSGSGSQFTKKYNIHKLVYFEIFSDPENAIKREKAIKGGSRSKKDSMITSFNPEWEDISMNII